MYTNLCIIYTLCLGSSATLLDDGNKSLDVLFRWRDLGSSGEFMIRDGGIMEGCGIIGSIDPVRDVDDVADFGILTNEMEWRMSLVCLTEGLSVSLVDVGTYFHGTKRRSSDEI